MLVLLRRVSKHEYAQYSYSNYSESRTSCHLGLPSRCVRKDTPERDLAFAISIAIVAFRILLIETVGERLSLLFVDWFANRC
jgi:hypothetical protein